MKQKRIGLTGAHAAALAMKQINPDVVAAYPITPQTPIMERFAEYVANGEVDTELIRVESEHSAMSACIGSSAAGARTMTATSANGLALMTEIVYIAPSYRLPIVMNLVNRALSGPINIHCDHSDAMLVRDSGWVMLFSENAQEVYDNNFIALRTAEDSRVLLPVMINQDGFITSHSLETLEVGGDKEMHEFVGEYNPRYSLLDTDNPHTLGPLDLYDYYFEHKRQQAEAMMHADRVIREYMKQYSELVNRPIDVVEPYRLDDAEFVYVAMNSTAGTLRVVVDMLRDKGVRAGLLKIRLYRPFPWRDVKSLLGDKHKIVVLDRALSPGATGGALYQDVRSSLYGLSTPIVAGYVYGLGGREFTEEQGLRIYEELRDLDDNEPFQRFMGVRE